MSDLPKTVIIGKVTKPHGIRGGVKIKPFTDDLDGFLSYESFFLRPAKPEKGNSGLEFKVTRINPLNGLFLVYFNGVDTVEQAEELRDMYLHVPRDTVIAKKDFSEKDILVDDLIGFRVWGDEKDDLGYVEGYYEGGSHGLYLVKSASQPIESGEIESREKKSRVGEGDFFIPCDLDFYQRIDFERKRIFVDSNNIVK